MPKPKPSTFRATATPVNPYSRGESRRPLRRSLPLLSLWLVLVLAAGWLYGLPGSLNFSPLPPGQAQNSPGADASLATSPDQTANSVLAASTPTAIIASLPASPNSTLKIAQSTTSAPANPVLKVATTALPAPVSAVTTAPPALSPTPRLSLETVLQQAIDKYKPSLGQSAEIGLVAHNLDTGEKFALNGQKVFETASLYKLFVMLTVYSYIDQGKLSLDDSITLTSAAASADEDGGSLIVPVGGSLPVRDLLYAMITSSNNTAGLMLLFKVGIPQMKQLVGDMGFKGADLSDSYNYRATAEDFDQFMERVANSKLLGPKYDPAMLDLLLHQTTRDRIPALLPADTRVANKTGNLSDIVNDTGIVYLPDGQRLALTVLVHQTSDGLAARKFISQFSLAAFNYFTSER